MKVLQLKTLFASLFLIPGVLTTYISAQTSENKDGLLVHRFTTNGSSLDAMSEYGFLVTKQMQSNPDVNLEIRLCTTQKMPIAVGTSPVDPISLTWFLMKMKTNPDFSVDRIVVTLHPECVEKISRSTATELWLVPKTSVLDHSQVSACRLRSTEYRSRKDTDGIGSVGTKSYSKAFERMYKDLSSGHQDSGLIIAYHNIGSKIEVRNQLKYLQNFAKKKKLDLQKLFFGSMEWNREDSVGEIKNVVIKAVRIVDQCAESGIRPEITLVD